jgi:tRNA(Ile)-lysidine synthase
VASSPAASLSDFIRRYPATAYLIGFSGGLDSHVLLHLCVSLRNQYPHLHFRALHVDHGLQAVSAAWAEHCRSVCQALDVPFVSVNLDLQPDKGESIEAVARDARYAVFQQHLQEGEMLLTAHHQDDQAETLLLHLLRGSGVDGLAAMPEVRPFASARLGRPLLPCSRQQLQTYAEQQQLVCLHDPSNADTRFDRNFLRHQVFPLLKQRWKSVDRTLARAARLQGESRELLGQFLQGKLAEVRGKQEGTLSVRALLSLGIPMQKGVLREWLRERGFVCPDEKRLMQVVDEVLSARSDASPAVHWHGCEVRRYRDGLYALHPLARHDPTQVLVWENFREPLFLPALGQTVQPEWLEGWYFWLEKYPQTITVRFRQGGESMSVPYRGGGHSLKHLLQEAGIPPWLRERLPLIYIGERLVAIAGVLTVNPTDADWN